MPITLDGTLGITTPALTVTGATVNTGGISTAGNLTFTSTGQRIIGDFSNATFANRVVFQTSTTNGATAITVAPNGTGTTALTDIVNSSDLANNSYARLMITNSEVTLRALYQGTGTALPLTFWTSGSERMRIDTSGNVMTGVTTALGKFSVAGGTYQISLHDGAGSSSSFGYLNYGGSTGAMILNAYSTGGSTYQAFYTSNSGTNAERMRIDSSGNVGIGTASPGYKLDVNGTLGVSGQITGNANNAFLNTARGANATYAIIGNTGGNTFVGRDDSTGSIITGAAYSSFVWATGAYPLLFATNGTERMRISSAGLVQVSASSTNNTFTGSGELAIKNSTNNPFISFHNNAGTRQGYIQGNNGPIVIQSELSYLSLNDSTGEVARCTGGNFQFSSGYGSVATAYGCRAWVNFDGASGTIRASGNVSSVTRNGTGDYTVNITNAMPDINYCWQIRASTSTTGSWGIGLLAVPTTTTLRFYTQAYNTSNADYTYVCVAVFR